MGLLSFLFKPLINNIKGNIGERKVDAKLNPLFFGKVYHQQINNLILIDDNNKTHQIDHVEIRENGIFCIETKNYKGWIFGDENSSKWTQCIYKEKNQFLNPLKQNKSHVYHLNQVLGKEYMINSLVVMVQNNAGRINCNNVINLRDLRRYLKNYECDNKLSIEEIDLIYNKLINASIKITNKEHVNNIKKTQIELNNGICPRCGGKLIKKVGKYGEFLGCSNYPKCKFIKNNNV